MKNKLLNILMMVVLILGVIFLLTGCGDDEEGSTKKKKNTVENNTTIENTTTNTISNNTHNDKIQEITSELPEGSSFFVTDVKDNGDTYTLQGIIYDEYIVTKDELNKYLENGKLTIDGETLTIKKEDDDDIEMYELCRGEDALYSIRKHEDGKYHLIRLAQISTCQRKTDKKRSITVSKSIACENLYTEELSNASAIFGDFTKTEAPENTHPTPSYTFEFKNGKCTKIFVDSGL